MAIDRQSIVDRVMHGAQLPASCFTPPNTAGYACQSSIPYDVDLARRTLAQAGYPNGRRLPPIEILFNTSENHKLIAEALQQMWRQNLNVAATLVNQEEKVYFDSRRQNGGNSARGRADLAGLFLHTRFFDPPERERLVSDDS